MSRLIGARSNRRMRAPRDSACAGRLIDRPMDQSDRPGGRSTRSIHSADQGPICSEQVPPVGLDRIFFRKNLGDRAIDQGA